MKWDSTSFDENEWKTAPNNDAGSQVKIFLDFLVDTLIIA